MDIVLWDGLFAGTTSIASVYELIKPVLNELEVSHPDDMMIQNKLLTYFVFILAGLIFAPFLLFPCLIPTMGEKFRTQLLTSIKGQEI